MPQEAGRGPGRLEDGGERRGGRGGAGQEEAGKEEQEEGETGQGRGRRGAQLHRHDPDAQRGRRRVRPCLEARGRGERPDLCPGSRRHHQPRDGQEAARSRRGPQPRADAPRGLVCRRGDGRGAGGGQGRAAPRAARLRLPDAGSEDRDPGRRRRPAPGRRPARRGPGRSPPAPG